MKFFKIKKSKIDNNGLYASCNIKKGTRIIEYKGKVITRKQSEESSKFDNSRAIYLFNLNKRFDLDGDFKFNTARLINHSCEPNCEVTGSGLKVWVYSIKDIKKNDFIYWKGHVAVALSNKKLIHAYGPKKKTVVMEINKTISLIKRSANLSVLSFKRSESQYEPQITFITSQPAPLKLPSNSCIIFPLPLTGPSNL